MKRLTILTVLFACLLTAQTLCAQDSVYYWSLMQRLASDECKGRGYVGDGDHIAANILSAEMQRLGLKTWTAGYQQSVPMPINVFDGDACVHFDSQLPDSNLVIFDNVTFMAYSCAMKGSFNVRTLKPEDLRAALDNPGNKYSNVFVCFDICGLNPKDSLQKALLTLVNQTVFKNPLHAKGYVLVSEKQQGFHLGYGQHPQNHVTVNINRNCLKAMPKKIDISLDQRFAKRNTSQNICGYIEGKTCPDSFFVFTGHYDHLGKFGRDYTCYGANDNASGTAMVMDLARHFSQPENRPDYSIAFMLFTGEEVGLVGSFYNSEHPLFPLENIKMLINLDMVGTNEDGITVVCAPSFQEDFDILTRTNDEKHYLKKVAPRKATANSDHYPFFKKGCKTFFIYGMGHSGRYHSQYDVPEEMTGCNYSGLFRLLTDYINAHGVQKTETGKQE